VKLNISKSGISTSIGVRGATPNVKNGRKSKVTVGVPGTGISYSSSIGSPPAQAPIPTGEGGSGGRVLAIVIVVLLGMFLIAIV
jgi:hypothetical protein